jgi:imidazolonepropionase-like amidohydrolase
VSIKQQQANSRASGAIARCVSAVLAICASAGSACAHDLIVHVGELIDGSGHAPAHQMSILIHDDQITGVKAGYVTQAGSTVIDLSNETVMPGFIDCHVHISAKLPGRVNATQDQLTHTDLNRAFDGAVFARQMLQQGFTSARDVGGGDETTAIRDAIRLGQISGPRLWVSLEPLGPTGGHEDPRDGLDPALAHPGWDNGLVDSVQQATTRVREHKRRGADLIKIMPSGGIGSSGDDPNRQLMTDDEMRAAVETAHALGMKVAAHIYPAAVIENAVRSGVDSIEHGSFATAQTFALMKSHGTFLVPTLTVYDVFYKVARERPDLLPPGSAAKELANDLLPKRNLALAVRSGVKIAYGTDIGEGDHAMEFALLTDNGMSAMDALLAATRNAAELIGASAQIGEIKQGLLADLVATKGDPLQRAELFDQVDFVMKGGIIYRQDGAATVAAAGATP